MAIWLLVFGVGTVLVRAGLTLLVSGCGRPRDAADALLRSFAEIAAAGLAFWIVGAPLLFGRQSRYVAFDLSLVLNQSTTAATSEFFHAIVATLGGAIVAGAVTGRARFHVSVIASAVLGGIAFPIVGHLVWFGWLRELNAIDFGGAAAVHLTGAVFAAVAVAMVGSRPGRYDRSAAIAPQPLGDLPMVAVGVTLAVAGWLPYLLASLLAHPTEENPMSPLKLAELPMATTAFNALLAAVAGGLGGIVYSRMRYGRADLVSTYLGLLGGLVSITASCVAVGNVGAVMIGGIGGALVPAAAGFMDRRARLDDPSGLIAVHGIGAIWAMIAAAMFAAGQSTIHHFQLLAVQALTLAVTLIVAVVLAALTFGLMRLAGPMREMQKSE